MLLRSTFISLVVGLTLHSAQAQAQTESAPTTTPPAQPHDADVDTSSTPEAQGASLSDDELQEIQKLFSPGDSQEGSAAPTTQAVSSPIPQLLMPQTPSLMNPAIALIFDVALAHFSEEESLQTGAHDPTETGFTLQQLEFHAESKVDQHFDLQANLVFSQFGVEIEELYAQTLSLPHSLQVRAGQYLIAFGRINQTHPHTWSFVDQALSVGTFLGSEGARGLGLEASWLLPLPWYAKLVTSVNQNAGECCAKSFVVGPQPKVESLKDLLYSARLEQFFELSDDWSLLAGGSYLLGENQTGAGNQSHVRGLDLFLKYKPLNSADRFYVSMQLEWFQRDRQVPGANYRSQTGYLELKSGINPSWEVAVRTEWLGKFQSEILDDSLEGLRSKHSAQVTFYPSHFSRIRAQVSKDDASWLDDPIWTSMLALEVLVGAHGAHKY